MEAFYNWQKTFGLGGERFGEVPDVEGFCDYIDSYRQLFMEYEKKPEYSTTVKKIKNWMYYRKKQLAMSGKINAAVYIFDAKNNHDYVDKVEQEIRQDVTSKGEQIHTGIDSDMLSQFLMGVNKDTKRWVL